MCYQYRHSFAKSHNMERLLLSQRKEDFLWCFWKNKQECNFRKPLAELLLNLYAFSKVLANLHNLPRNKFFQTKLVEKVLWFIRFSFNYKLAVLSNKMSICLNKRNCVNAEIKENSFTVSNFTKFFHFDFITFAFLGRIWDCFIIQLLLQMRFFLCALSNISDHNLIYQVSVLSSILSLSSLPFRNQLFQLFKLCRIKY